MASISSQWASIRSSEIKTRCENECPQCGDVNEPDEHRNPTLALSRHGEKSIPPSRGKDDRKRETAPTEDIQRDDHWLVPTITNDVARHNGNQNKERSNARKKTGRERCEQPGHLKPVNAYGKDELLLAFGTHRSAEPAHVVSTHRALGVVIAQKF